MYSATEPEMLFKSLTKEIQWNEDRYQLALICQNKKLLKVDSIKMTKNQHYALRKLIYNEDIPSWVLNTATESTNVSLFLI